MNILFLTNNIITQPLFKFLQNQSNIKVFLFSDKLNVEIIEQQKTDMIVSYNYKYIIYKPVLDCVNRKAINLHISYLPWNRGAQPNFWSFFRNTPKGVTIHLIDEGLDTGDILLQKRLYFDENVETLSSTYEDLHYEIQKLFIKNWDQLKHFEIIPKKQTNITTIHFSKNINCIKEIIGEEIWSLKINNLKIKCEHFVL